MKKRLSAALLAVCLALVCFPTCALASSPGFIPPNVFQSNPKYYYTSLPPFLPAPGWENDNGVIAWSKLNNLIWFAWALEDFENGYELPFTDVPEDSWFYPGVCYVHSQSLMGGVSANTFAPYEPVTRGMAWTVLARMSGQNPKAAPGTAWYEPGMAWAVEHGVTDGSNPLSLTTREEWVSMLWRRAGQPSAELDLNVFSDGGTVSDYAQDAMRWAVSIGIIQGSNGQLAPKGTLSRAELASMIMRIVPKPR